MSGQDWQPELWRELVARTLALSPSGYHRANLYEAFIHELGAHPGTAGQAAPTGLRVRHLGPAAPLRGGPAGPRQPPRGGGTPVCDQPLPLLLGDLLDRKTLARLENKLKPGTDLETLQGPANPLLASMGKLGRDYLHQLMELEVPQIEAFVDIEDRDDEGKVTLLRAIQKDVLELAERGQASSASMPATTRAPVSLDDGTLQIHACHGPMRELEVLHDRLLALFEQDPTLTPKTWW